MAYSIKMNHPGCPVGKVAVVNGAGIKMSCHPDEASARAAMGRMMAADRQDMPGDTASK